MLCKYICSYCCEWLPWGLLLGLGDRNCLHCMIDRAVGKAKQMVISLSVKVHLTKKAVGPGIVGRHTQLHVPQSIALDLGLQGHSRILWEITQVGMKLVGLCRKKSHPHLALSPCLTWEGLGWQDGCELVALSGQSILGRDAILLVHD